MYGQRCSLPIAATVLFLLLLLLSFMILTGCRGGQPPAAGEDGFLVIRGAAVESEVRLSMEEIKALEGGLVEDDYFSVNSYGTKQYFHFKGVWVWHLLKEKANLKEHASRLSFIAGDGYEVEYTLEEVKRDDYIDEQNPEKQYKMILAWEEDGWEYNPGEGNPLKLVVGQREPGDVNKPYWVRNVKTIRVD
jgi:hypothetical protein